RNSGILHLEGADQGQSDFVSAPGVGNCDDLGKAIDRSTSEPDIFALLADRDDLQTALLRCLNHLAGVAVVDAYHRCPTAHDQILEQAQLGSKVGFDCRMIVEMITREICEGTGCDAHAIEAALVKAVR